MTKNAMLKLRLWEKGMSQEMLSKETGIPRSYISLGINGRYLFDDGQKERISKALGLPENLLFGKE